MPKKLAEITIQGYDDVIRNLKQLDHKIQLKVMRSALRAGAKVIQRNARQLVPTDTGNMKKNIKLKSLKRSKKQMGVNIVTGTRESMGIPQKGKGYYPFSVEYGTSEMKAQPFMRPALEGNRVAATKAIGDTLEKGIKKVVAKMKKVK